MNNKWVGIFVAGAMLVSSGCATMSGDECMTSDWHAIGYEDGARGSTADQLGHRRKACAKHGVTPDFQSYQAGRTDGLREYCQPQRGFNLGASGGRYNGVCAIDLEGPFLDAYREGSQLHTLRSSVNSANYQIKAKERELDDVAATIRTAEAELIAADTTVQDRILILADLKELSERTGQLESEIDNLIEERAIAEQQLANYEAILANTGY